MVRTDEWRSREGPLVGARRRRDRGFEADASPTPPYLFRKWYGERDLNPQRAALKAAAYAISPPPREVPPGVGLKPG